MCSLLFCYQWPLQGAPLDNEDVGSSLSKVSITLSLEEPCVINIFSLECSYSLKVLGKWESFWGKKIKGNLRENIFLIFNTVTG